MADLSDIRSETQVAEGVPAGGYLDDDVEYAEGEWVANPETGEMEWHAADGTVVTQAEFEAGETEAEAETAVEVADVEADLDVEEAGAADVAELSETEEAAEEREEAAEADEGDVPAEPGQADDE